MPHRWLAMAAWPAPPSPPCAHRHPPVPADTCLQASNAASHQRATAEVQQQFKELTLTPAQREGKEPVFEGRVTGAGGWAQAWRVLGGSGIPTGWQAALAAVLFAFRSSST